MSKLSVANQNSDYGLVTLTRRKRAVWLAKAKVSRMVTVSFGDPIREISAACAVSTMFEPA